MSAEYENALLAFRIASAAHGEIVRKYRARIASDTEYIESRGRFDAAQKLFDTAEKMEKAQLDAE